MKILHAKQQLLYHVTNLNSPQYILDSALNITTNILIHMLLWETPDAECYVKMGIAVKLFFNSERLELNSLILALW